MPWNEGLSFRLGVIVLLGIVVVSNVLLFTVSFTSVSLRDKVSIFLFGMLTMGVILFVGVLRIRGWI